MKALDPNTSSSDDPELWNSQWLVEDNLDDLELNSSKDVLLSIAMHCDETGMDSSQRYFLEPFLMSNQNDRESQRSWRHLGFVPANKQQRNGGFMQGSSVLSQLSFKVIG